MGEGERGKGKGERGNLGQAAYFLSISLTFLGLP